MNKKIEQHTDMLRYLYQQSSGSKRFNITKQACIIKSIVPQGNILFAIARYPDQIVPAVSGDTPTIIPGGYIGNEANINENKLVLGEILIQTDIDLRNIKGFNPQNFIGQQAQAEFYDGRPIRILISPTTVNSRTIPKQIIESVRATNDAQDMTTPGASTYIQALGYSKDDFSAIKKEKVSDIKPDGFILVYGNSQDWFRESIEDAQNNSSFKDISSFSTASTILGLPSSVLKQFVCYSPPILFSGY